MIDENGIKQLKEVFATKDELADMGTRIYSQIDAMHQEMKSNYNQMKSSYDALLTNSDRMVEIISTQRQEQTLIIKDQEKHEKWIHQIADETDVVLQS